MAADKGKEIVPPVVLINELEELKRKLDSGGRSSALMQGFAELKQKFSVSATAAREAGNSKLSQVFVKEVSPLMKEIEVKLLEKNHENISKQKVETFPRSSKDKWDKFAEKSQNVVSAKGVDKVIEKALSEKRPSQPSKVAEQKNSVSKMLTFKMGGHRG